MYRKANTKDLTWSGAPLGRLYSACVGLPSGSRVLIPRVWRLNIIFWQRQLAAAAAGGYIKSATAESAFALGASGKSQKAEAAHCCVAFSSI